MAVAAQAQWPYYNNYYNNWAAPAVTAPALPTTYAAGYPYYAGYPAALSANQYHSQDEFGQTSFGYAHPGQTAVNHRDAFGNQVGSWAYINPEGKEVRVSYTADSRGFRVISNDLPVGPSAMPNPVQDTAEVAAAKAAHFAAHANVKAGIYPRIAAPNVNMPAPVDYTPEVAAARAEHARAWAEAKAAADAAPEEGESRKKRHVLAYNSLLASPFAHSFATPYAHAFATPYTQAFAAPYALAAPAVPVREATLTKTVLNPVD